MKNLRAFLIPRIILAEHAMERKATLMKRKSGGDVRIAKGQAAENDSKKSYLVLAPSYNVGKLFFNKMGWKEDHVAVVTDPEHIRGCRVEPGEDVYILRGTDGIVIGEFVKNLNVASNHFKNGEHYNLKIVS